MGRSRRPAVLVATTWVAIAILLGTQVAFALPGQRPAVAPGSAAGRWSLVGADPSPAPSASPGTLEPSPGPSVIDVDPRFATGPFDLPDPTVGLAELTNYVATLAITFDGARSGTPINASTSTTLSVSPEGRVLTIERGADGPTTYRAEIAGTSYAKEGDGPCTVASIEEGETLAGVFEPAALLPSLVGAAEASSGTINGAEAVQHTFDRSSVVLLGLDSATGEVWTAEPGAQVVRYLLRLEAGPAYFGEDTTGTRTLDYQLTVPEEPKTFQLPAGCPAQLPLLRDATDVDRWSDLLTFRSAMPVDKAAKSYGKLLKALGWKVGAPEDIGTAIAVLTFRRRRETATVIMRADPDGTAVKVVLTR